MRRVPCAAVLVLLAPSEGKTAPTVGAPLDLAALVHPELTPQRDRLLTALTKLSAGRPSTALERLGLSRGQAPELQRNAQLHAAPTAPAADVYAGVLYQHLDLPSLDPASAERARRRLLIASALFGVVALTDPIPAYRLAIGADLPRIANLAAWWRPHLTRALPSSGLVVDLRSQAYAAAWRPAQGELVGVRVVDPEGKVVSHMAKATRGEVARRLAQEPTAPGTPRELAELVGGQLESGAKGWTLTVVG